MGKSAGIDGELRAKADPLAKGYARGLDVAERALNGRRIEGGIARAGGHASRVTTGSDLEAPRQPERDEGTEPVDR